MWGAPGRAYVYLIYGYHVCVNAVCCAPGKAEAVLIRAIKPALGEELMRRNRRVENRHHLTNGPAKLCAAMGIDRNLDGANLCDPASKLFIAANDDIDKYVHAEGPVVTAVRVGLSKAAHLPLRFYLAGSPFVSRRKAASSGGVDRA